MKKHTFLISAFSAIMLACAAFTVSGCGDGKKSKPAAADSSKGKKSAAKGKSKESAGDGQSSIQFYNDFLKFGSASQSIFKKVHDALEDSDKFVGNDYDSGKSKQNWGGLVLPTAVISKVPKINIEAPEDFTKADKAYINPRIEAVKKDVTALLKEIEDLKTYYKAEDHKDDWHKKFLMSRPRVEGLMERIVQNNKEIIKLADKLSEEVDRRNVAKAPDGAFILNMRYMIDKAKERADVIFEARLEDVRYGCGVSEEEHRQMVAKASKVCDTVDALTKELDEMAGKYKNIDKKVIKGTQAEKVYDGFFSSHEKAGEDLRRIVRNLREKGYTNDQRAIGDTVGSLVKAHNAFLEARKGK